ncbi:hypothetical protein PG999_008575 [Apiospora kogelbergensis]|uniref:F-box domain-containing protein n=1 Tax=Apiospora kogelbergensis TaxID=1337665 RepID=A0AAW0QSI9_9PEZI
MATNYQTELPLLRIPQEVLDNITDRLQISEMRNLALTCKHMHDGIMHKMWDVDNKHDCNALFYSAQHGRVEILKQVIERRALRRLDCPSDEYMRTNALYRYTPSNPLVRALVCGHPVVAKMLLEVGAENTELTHLLSTGSREGIMPINLVLDQMTRTPADDKIQQQWKKVLELLLLRGGPACPSPFPAKRMVSALCQSIHPLISPEITSILIEQGQVREPHLITAFKFSLDHYEMKSAMTLAMEDVARSDPSSEFGRDTRARFEILRAIFVRKW